MEPKRQSLVDSVLTGFVRKLARDRAGNTAVLIAASIAPLLALIGGGIDMSRSYLSQARLQQACDSGVLAARKALGSEVVVDGNVPSDVSDIGNRFFNINFREGAYGSEDRSFAMTMEESYAVRGVASVRVPTTIMAIFGNTEVDVNVDCEAQINFSDTDIMFVLDTTGSMTGTNPGDDAPRIDALRSVVKDFHTQVEGSKTAGTRIRYGFVPYATNVNVGHLLADDWVVDEWTYQSRERIIDEDNVRDETDWINWDYISGDYDQQLIDSYDAVWQSGSGEYNSGSYRCPRANPHDTASHDYDLISTVTEPYAGPPAGTITTEHYRRISNGTTHWTSRDGATCQVWQRTYDDYVIEYDRVTYPAGEETWLYKPVTLDVSNWRAETDGCIEERDTYEIYTKLETVDTARALDLNLDLVPSAGNPSTQWRPMYPDIVWARALHNENANSWSVEEVEYRWDYFKPAWYPALVACPNPAQLLQEMDSAQVAAYVDGLDVLGQTYHDIGMIWGGRLISPSGLFAAENASRPSKETARHLIFLTDGQTEPLDIAYASYGLEQLELRRWTQRPDPLIDRVIELRFYHACKEVKKLNVTVWVIGFGTTMNDVMKECAGDGHWFQADDADELEDSFNKIAKSLAELRVSE